MSMHSCEVHDIVFKRKATFLGNDTDNPATEPPCDDAMTVPGSDKMRLAL